MKKQSDPKPYRSGELARLAGVSSDTLRHYERIGVLAAPSRTSAGYRQYAPEALDRVRVIRRALAVGFSLKELARVFRVRAQGGVPCGEVRALAARKLVEVDQRIVEITALRKDLKRLIAQWDNRIAGTPKGERSYLLDGFAKDGIATEKT